MARIDGLKPNDRDAEWRPCRFTGGFIIPGLLRMIVG